MALMLFIVPIVGAETLPPEVAETELLTKEMLGSQVGMILIAGFLTQGIKLAFMRNSGTDTIRKMALIVSFLVVIVAKLLFGMPFDIADILILPGNAIIIWLATMKGYEQTIGTASTPAGNTQDNIH
ncbi:MAG: hypothetical protein ACOX7B_03225 [Christensenellales bacterium]